MAEVIPFPLRVASPDEEGEIDIMTAVDAAIRDLRDIARTMDVELSRARADETRAMLERAFAAAREA
jgi:hypothetical protein